MILFFQEYIYVHVYFLYMYIYICTYTWICILERNRDENNGGNRDSSRNCNRQRRYKWKLIRNQSANSRRFGMARMFSESIIYVSAVRNQMIDGATEKRGISFRRPSQEMKNGFQRVRRVKAGNEFRGAASPQAAVADWSNNTDDCGHVVSIA